MAVASVYWFVADEENSETEFSVAASQTATKSSSRTTRAHQRFIIGAKIKCPQAPSLVDIRHTDKFKLFLAGPRRDLVTEEKVRNALFGRA